MKKFKLFSAIICSVIFTHCSSIENDLVEPSSVNVDTALEGKNFVSENHKQDYVGYITGKLSIADIKTKYGLNDLDVPDESWDLIFRGELDVMELDDSPKTASAKSEGAGSISRIIMKKVLRENNPDFGAELSGKLNIDSAPSSNQTAYPGKIKIKESTAQKPGTIGNLHMRFSGNMLFHFKVVMSNLVALPSNETGNKLPRFLIRDVNYQPQHIKINSKGKLVRILVYDPPDPLYVWQGDSYYTTIPWDSFTHNSDNRVDVDVFAWFHFFWINLGIDKYISVY